MQPSTDIVKKRQCNWLEYLFLFVSFFLKLLQYSAYYSMSVICYLMVPIVQSATFKIIYIKLLKNLKTMKKFRSNCFQNIFNLVVRQVGNPVKW